MENSSSSVSTNDHYPYLNNLPDLVYYHILKNLDLDDLWNFRLINKKFYSIIKNYQIKELSLVNSYFRDYDNWFSTLRSSRTGYQLPLFKKDLLTHPSDNLVNLKCLRIEKIDHNYFGLEELNKFTKLQILEIRWSDFKFDDLLQLPDLKALSIYISTDKSEDGISIVIDTPNLHSLSIYFQTYLIYDLFEFNHPHSIKYLRLHDYDKNASIFTNLECLELYRISNLESSDLLKFDNLKSLRTNDWLNRYKVGDLFRSKKDDLEFVIHGVRIKEINKIDEYENTWSRLEFQLNNYGELVDDLWFVKKIDYDKLVRVLPANKPDDLLKFTNIQEIKIGSRVEDDNQLIRLIRGSPNLYQLEIKNSSLDQQFYDQLPTFKSLRFLFIYEDKDLNLDFKFLIKMPYLQVLFTDQDVLIDSQLSLNNCKRLRCFRLKIKDRKFEIEKETRDRYKIRYCNKKLDLPENAVDYNTLVEWSNQLRCKK